MKKSENYTLVTTLHDLEDEPRLRSCQSAQEALAFLDAQREIIRGAQAAKIIGSNVTAHVEHNGMPILGGLLAHIADLEKQAGLTPNGNVPDTGSMKVAIGDPEGEKELLVTVQGYGQGVGISVDGYGHSTTEDPGEFLWLELYEGTLQLHVWADINDDDITDKIDLSGAREDRRKE